ncbi:MAG: mandelate racemase/muconate lactonizing enzyme family protein [Pseudomonadota bacterium]|nr:mandelate racemase/muconate lactonizing enzyme family protein [Pseudomonadota bacterium]
MNDDSFIQLRSVRTSVYRAPIETPVQTSFGLMRDRPMVLVEVTDADGHTGWGEVWCNFPEPGAEHRARLVDRILAPLACGTEGYADPPSLYDKLTRRTEVLALQSGEPGPFAHAIAGIDIAVWDLMARRRKLPLWRMLGGSSDRVPVYASGINPTAPERTVERCRAEGHRRFKLKIGFDPQRDRANLAALRDLLGSEAPLMVDANQAWTLAQASQIAPTLQDFDLCWLEEPLRADRPWAEWLELQRHCAIPLAGGENIAGDAAFDAALAAGALAVLQPDAAKWGGISALLPLARRIHAAGRRYCPHYLGGGVGLLASAHLLAATGGDGWLEIDSNPNPLRSLLCGALASIDDGHAALGEAPGLGLDVDRLALADWRVPHDHG